ncbi:apses-type HTH transcription regulator [Rhizophagus clarus]|uniref:Apses-type HTH transcription regulator n=1 Tax=Rhizophagus clarus TaxID=94130 RepID=A0A8H3KQI8_9GLOM|nr:apses-type HTH transcription regulator [Rhizophagus clarus]
MFNVIQLVQTAGPTLLFRRENFFIGSYLFGAHYSQTQQHPNTPPSPASTFSNNTTTSIVKTESPRTNSIKNTTITTSTTTTNTKSNSPSSNPNSPAGTRSLTSTATQTSPPVSQPHSAFSPYNQQHPTPVTNPTKNSISSQSDSPTMMTTSHLDNSVGYSAAASSLAQGHTPRPKLTTTIWEDEQTLCYQVDARGICVARRQDNDMINGTKLLNVVGMSRGKRDGILKNEKGRVVVKVGAMHLKGVWITFQRAKTLAAQFKISELLYPLFVEDPSIFLHNSYGPPMSTRIPSIGAGPGSQWRPTHPYTNNFNNGQYTPESTRQWYPYGNSNPLMTSPSTPQGQEHGSTQYPQNAGYPDRSAATPPAVPIYSTHPPSRNHNAHAQPHLEEYDATSYNLINGQSQGQQGVQGVVVSGGPATEDNNASNGNGYIRSGGQGLYNLVSAADVVGASPGAQASPQQLIGQKRGYVGDEDNDEYNAANNASPSPPITMHPPPPLNSIAVSTSMNAAAGSFPSPMHASPNSSPSNSAFSGWNHPGKRVKYESQFPEATTPSSSHSSPRINSNGYQLPGLGAGPATPGANPSTPGYTNSNLQMVTNAQSPHNNYSSATNNNGGAATGTTTPTTDGLDRYFDQSTVLHTPTDSVVGTPEEPTGMRGRYEQYRQREDPPATEEITGF